jgi:thiosulfate/3-mercaptopyruvate sulfurtransferase
MTLQKQLEYVHPEVLVDSQWAEDHLKDPKVRIVEVDYDSSSNYKLGHIPGSVLFDWKKDINEPLSRNILTRQETRCKPEPGHKSVPHVSWLALR